MYGRLDTRADQERWLRTVDIPILQISRRSCGPVIVREAYEQYRGWEAAHFAGSLRRAVDTYLFCVMGAFRPMKIQLFKVQNPISVMRAFKRQISASLSKMPHVLIFTLALLHQSGAAALKCRASK